MKLVTVKQIQHLDRIAIKRIGIPSLVLMENAGRTVALVIKKYLKRTQGKRVCIVCGVGNNAGDGFVVARHLIEAGINTDVVYLGRADKLKADALVNFKILKNLKSPLQALRKVDRGFQRALKNADIVVDAIFGVGLNREVREPFYSVIEAINTHAKMIFAVDIPSGLNGTTGEIYGTCIRAKKTITFSFMKQGFIRGDGPKHVGKVRVVDIGIPKKCQSQIKI